MNIEFSFSFQFRWQVQMHNCKAKIMIILRKHIVFLLLLLLFLDWNLTEKKIVIHVCTWWVEWKGEIVHVKEKQITTIQRGESTMLFCVRSIEWIATETTNWDHMPYGAFYMVRTNSSEFANSKQDKEENKTKTTLWRGMNERKDVDSSIHHKFVDNKWRLRILNLNDRIQTKNLNASYH